MKRIPAYVWLLAPALLFVAAMALFPLLYSLVLSFREWKLAQSDVPGQWVGLDNYWYLLTDDPELMESLWATLIFVGFDVALTVLAALCAALLLQKPSRMSTFTRILLILPFVMSPALIGISFRFFLNPEFGILQFLLSLVIPALDGRIWLADRWLSMTAVITSDIWHWAPYMTLVILGGLASIPKETQEAAQIDGASHWQVFKDVTFPQLKPVLGIVLVLKTVFALKAFDTIFTLSNGGPGTSTQTLAYFVYHTAFHYYDLGYAAAAAYLLTALLMICSFFYLRLIFKK
ncbi:MAG: sugar ABC transporter permease [Betaproteobacteria bacterium]|jgi:multiple sugar transport system permease protein|nr:sugar ABC transporter permease [Betaproteobacteria bacterium]NBT68573.1 sugar ABC transporter permease [Betaproteobacteria bacterium]NBY07339.1 sugar ABC transporter permease [Betaproteobacteria bacterium]